MYLRLNTNNTCNLNCIHCYYKSKVGFDWQFLLLNEAKNIIEQAHRIYKNNLFVVLMWWGEPFLYKYLFEILDYLSKLDIPSSITTNWTLLDKEYLRKLKKFNTLLNISIEGNKKYNDLIRGIWTFDKILENVFNCIDLWIRFSINFTLTKENIFQIPFLVKKFSKNAEYITFSRYIPYIENKNMHSLSQKDYLILQKILDRYKKNKLKFRQEKFLNRNLNNFVNTFDFNPKNLKSLYILPNKTVYPAWNLIDYKLWNLEQTSLWNILNNGKLEKLYNPENLNWKFCSKCKYKYSCIGDRGVAYFYTWNFWWDDIQCPYYLSI